ncbi:hypothetical protein A6R71_05320 [Xanthomonas translucens pv. arrhenatheri]|nr:hypothetical protein A6R71_05320 [Xanthomonas translucens pv. arrhenatheri]
MDLATRGMSGMHWSKAFTYAGVLLVVQFALGVAEGVFFPESATGIAFLLLDAAVSFSVCAGIFAHLSAHQSVKPFAHAWAALFLQAGAVGAVGAGAQTMAGHATSTSAGPGLACACLRAPGR